MKKWVWKGDLCARFCDVVALERKGEEECGAVQSGAVQSGAVRKTGKRKRCGVGVCDAMD